MIRRSKTLRLTRCALFAALIAVLAQIHFPLPPVPASLSLLGVHIAGLLLGPADGIFAVCTYLMMGLFGLPVFAGFSGGPAILFGPTGGYLFGYVVCAAVSGFAAQRFGLRSARLFGAMILGTLICSTMGAVGVFASSGTVQPSIMMFAAFLPGDAIKIVLAVLIARRLDPLMR